MKTTHTIWNIIDDGEILEPVKGSSCTNVKNGILFEISSDDEDGTYPRVSDYVRFVNSLDEQGTSYFINRCTRKKNKKAVDFMGIKIIRESDYQDEAILEFPEPVEVVLGKVGEELVTRKVRKMSGNFTHDYFWTKRGRQDKIANGFEIWFNIKEYLE